MVTVAASQTAPPLASPPDAIPSPIRAAFDREDWSAAESQLRSYLAVQPDSAEALYLLGATLFHRDQPKESLEVFTRAAQKRRPGAEDLRTVALDYVLLNDYDDADKWIRVSVREGPTDGESWYAMGRILYTENQFAAAVASFQQAIHYMPHSVKAENNLGLAYEGLNQPEQAMASYRQAMAWQTEGSPPDVQPLINLGILLADRNQFDEALTVLRRAEEMAPKDGRLHGALGKLYTRRGELPAAQAELEQAVAAKPEDAGLHFQLGQVYRREGMAERAAAELGRAATLERQGRH